MRTQYEFTHADGSPGRLVLDDGGMAVTFGDAGGRFDWTTIASADARDDGVVIVLTNFSRISISIQSFRDHAEQSAFVAHLRERIAQATDTPAAESVPTDAALTLNTSAQDSAAQSPFSSDTPRPPLAVLRQNIDSAFRLAAFSRPAEGTVTASWWLAMTFAFLSMVAPVVWAFAVVGEAGEWNLYALPAAMFHIPVLLIAAVCIAYSKQRPDDTLLLFQVFLMIAFAIDVVYYILFFISYRLPEQAGASTSYPYIYYGCALWTGLACARTALRFSVAPLRVISAPTLISLLLIALPLATVFRDRSLWERDYGREQAAPAARDDITNEDNFYRQPLILEQELAAIQPQRPGITDVYFIGMAGYGNQDVFRREVDSVTALFRERFDAAGRTVRLINNPKLAASAPVASITSLRASLKRVAQVMDRDEDVLVLFLTSHGSETHRFSLELWPLQFKELDPPALRTLLDESGIRHRVVVISACYSGGFINALKNDDTLIITAAAPDRNSFGCSNENDWTYFGKAFFDEALRTTWSFSEAFERAGPLIAEREAAQKFKPSNPQMIAGRHITATLARLESELADPVGREKALLAAQPAVVVDAAARYAALRYDHESVAHQVRVCKATAHASGPDVVIATQPNAYGGLGPGSPLWPRLVGAWKRYIDNVCDRTRDPALLQSMYAQFLREAKTGAEVGPILRFADTPEGKRWLKAEKSADQKMASEITRIQSENQASLYKIFLDEQQAVFNAFRAGTKAKP